MQPWQTRSADFHPYMIDALDALPPSLAGVAQAALPAGEGTLRGFVVPADYRSPDGVAAPRVVPAQALLFTPAGIVHVQAAQQGAPAPQPVFLQPQKLLWMRSSHLLLHGKLELVCAMQGEARALQIEFNAVGWRLMQPEWHGLVGQAIGVTLPPESGNVAGNETGNETGNEDEGHTFAGQEMVQLAMGPDKFVDGLGRYGLYTGEKLLGVVYQPAVWKQNLIAFDEQLLPNTLLALTDASVLILAEESALVRKSEQFGLIITRLPRAVITAVDGRAAADGRAAESLQTVHFALERDGVRAEQGVLLTPESAEAWLELWNRQSYRQ